MSTDTQELAIPRGLYCYEITGSSMRGGMPVIRTRVCPYWYGSSDRTAAKCRHPGSSGWSTDPLLDDQIKACGLNTG